MNEWNTSESKREDQGNLEDNLFAYYGPELPPQPLPPTSWAHLRSRLGQQQLQSRRFRLSRRRMRFLRIARFANSSTVPVSVQDVFDRIAHEARLSYSADIVHCTYKKRGYIPSVHVSYWGKRKIHLLLPAYPLRSLEPAELNVLLASGLATYQLLFERKVPFGLLRMLIVWACLLVLIGLIAVGRQHFDVVILPIAIALVVLLTFTLVVSHRRGRALAFRVDALMVLWLGRSQVCEGLHALVQRSRHPQRKGFGQVSIAERIERVCGTRVPPENERLTLVH